MEGQWKCVPCQRSFKTNAQLTVHRRGKLHRVKVTAQNAVPLGMPKQTVFEEVINSRLLEPQKRIVLCLCDRCMESQFTRHIYSVNNGKKMAISFLLCKDCVRLTEKMRSVC